MEDTHEETCESIGKKRIEHTKQIKAEAKSQQHRATCYRSSVASRHRQRCTRRESPSGHRAVPGRPGRRALLTVGTAPAPSLRGGPCDPCRVGGGRRQRAPAAGHTTLTRRGTGGAGSITTAKQTGAQGQNHRPGQYRLVRVTPLHRCYTDEEQGTEASVRNEHGCVCLKREKT